MLLENCSLLKCVLFGLGVNRAMVLCCQKLIMSVQPSFLRSNALFGLSASDAAAGMEGVWRR